MNRIRVAIVGVGNCASSLVQGIHYYKDNFSRDERMIGLAHPILGGYAPGDVDIVAAIDIDKRKVGKPLHEAIFAKPNCTKVFYDRFRCDDVIVRMGNVLDGVAPHMTNYSDDRRFIVADAPQARQEDVEELLKETEAEILMNYLPVGSQKATEFCAECCISTGVSFINCIPVFIVSDPTWARRFTAARIPCVGDDVKAQVGATITHRVLARMMADRGAKIDATYQLNTGGNTDFLNMVDQSRLGCKKVSKTEAVQ
ncbi:MAG: inositol-3-phosphate synthase, partial [Planctomycetota bacterium]